MDTYGILAFVVFAILWLVLHKKVSKRAQDWTKVSLFGMGVGVGLTAGAIWAAAIVTNTLNAMF